MWIFSTPPGPPPLKCGKYKCLSKWSLGVKTHFGRKKFFPPRNTKTLRQISMYSGRMSGGGVWLKNNMCLNGLKWLKTHFKTMFVFYKKVWIWGWPPPSVEKIHTFYFFFLKASLRYIWDAFKKKKLIWREIFKK